MVEFAILGPVEARLDDTPSALRGRPLSLLSLLLVHGGALVHSDRIAEDLWWGEVPPENPQNAVQIAVSRVRKALGRGAIVSRAGSYAVHLAPGALDAGRFADLLAQGRGELVGGRPEAAATTLREALALWRGPALADVRREPFAQPEIARLEELRLDCVAERIDADLACGRHAEVIGELRVLIGEHPLRERLHGALMLALYRDGRQGEALETYREARRALVEGLGIEPSPELRSLQRQVLQQDDPQAPRTERRKSRPAAVQPARLPRPPLPLVGRHAELATVVAALRDGTGLLTLTGPGGVGKTHLALEAAADASDAFPDGVHFVALAPVRDPAQVAGQIARAVAPDAPAGPDPARALAERLRDRRVLLLVDNAEHVLAATAGAIDELRAIDGVTLLVTSRECLGLRGEATYSVPPLSEEDAVALYVERTRGLDPAFVPTPEVPELCRRLDRLPLALELAAARSTVFSPAQLLARLSERLDLLDGGSSAEARQRTLRATTEWSANLLDDAERRLFRRLSVFAGDASWAGAEAVCEAHPDALQSLVDKHLVTRHAAADGAWRFGMGETIRQFAADELARSPDEEDACRRRHADYFTGLAEAAVALHEPAVRFLELEAERANLSAAVAFLHEQAAHEAELRLVGALVSLWRGRGPAADGIAALEAALAGCNELSAACVNAAIGLGVLVAVQGDDRRALRIAEDAREHARALGDARIEARALNLSGNAALGLWDLEASARHYVDSIALWRPLGLSRGLIAALANFGHVLVQQGDYSAAQERLEEAVALAVRLGDRQHASHCMYSLGLLAILEGRNDDARDVLRCGLELATEVGLGPVQLRILTLFAVLNAADPGGRGARLLGVRDRHSEVLDVGPGPSASADGQLRAAAVTAAMRALGPAGYNAGYAEGRAMPVADAVADALASPATAPCAPVERRPAVSSARGKPLDRIVQELAAIAPSAKLLQLSTHP